MARKSVRRRHIKQPKVVKQEKVTPYLREKDFIIYLSSALVLKGVVWINKDNARPFVEAMQAAYDTLKEYLNEDRLMFGIYADPIHGNSGTVDQMIIYLCDWWARRGENRNVIFLDTMPESIALHYLDWKQAHNKEAWLLAADSFIRYAARSRAVGLRADSAYSLES